MKYFFLLQAINAKFTTPDDIRYLGMTNEKLTMVHWGPKFGVYQAISLSQYKG